MTTPIKKIIKHRVERQNILKFFMYGHGQIGLKCKKPLFLRMLLNSKKL